MLNWLCKLICKNTEGSHDDRMDTVSMEQRILDIRRRIEEQRARLGYTQTRSDPTRYDEQIPRETPRVDQAREAKNAELNDLKAKLLGKKK